jgi:acyl carrier protein
MTDTVRTQPSTPTNGFNVGTPDDVEEEISNTVAAQLGVPRATITPAASFEDVGADICDLAEIVLLVEEAFDIEISADEVDRLFTVGDLIAAVRDRAIQAPSARSMRTD